MNLFKVRLFVYLLLTWQKSKLKCVILNLQSIGASAWENKFPSEQLILGLASFHDVKPAIFSFKNDSGKLKKLTTGKITLMTHFQ